jgi:hypothetical protein
MQAWEAMMIAGLCLIVAAAAVLVVTWAKTVRHAGEPAFRLGDAQRALRLDLYMAVVWTGMLLVQLSNVLLHVQTGSTHNISRLSWIALAGALFVCGAFTGRLLLRLEMRRSNAMHDEPAGRISEA